MTIALLDGDIIAFRCAAACQQTLDWGDGSEKTLSVDTETAISTALDMVRNWTELARCKVPLVCFSADLNWRHAIYPDYKISRRGGSKPQAYGAVVEAIEAEFKAIRMDGLEADDVMGILATSPAEQYRGAVIVTLDKDLATVPGRHVNPNKDIMVRRISPQVADFNWHLQTLMGDRTDDIPGIHGVGPKKAEKILQEAPYNDYWGAILGAYQAAGLGGTEAILNARLTRILRRTDYDRENNEVILWHPTNPERLAVSSLTPPPPKTEATATPKATGVSTSRPSKGTRRASSR